MYMMSMDGEMQFMSRGKYNSNVYVNVGGKSFIYYNCIFSCFINLANTRIS